MTYWLLFNVAVAVVTVAAVYLLNRPNQQEEQRHRPHNNRENDRDGASDKTQKNLTCTRKPCIGDTCIVCLKVMTEENMHFTICNHALHKKCFAFYTENGIDKCPTCFNRMVYSVPGDACVICRQELLPEHIEYLKCGHALHEECLIEMKTKRYNKCPSCRKDI